MMENTPFDNRFFVEVYDSHPQAIIWLRPIFNADGNTIDDFEYAYSNDEGLKYLNLSAKQFNGLKVSNSPTLTDDLRKEVMDELTAVYQTGKKIESSLYNPALDKYAKVLRTRLRGGILSVVQDRTVENRTIQQLEYQSRYLNSVLNTSLNATVTLEAVRGQENKIVDLAYKQVNNKFLEYFSKTEVEVVGTTMLQLFPGTWDSGIFDVYCRVIETGTPIHTEIKYVDGNNIIWYDLSVAQLNENTAVGNFNDVTRRKQAFELIEQQKSLLDNILKHSSNGITVGKMMRDRNGSIIDIKTLVANDAAVKFTGVPKEEYLSKTAAEVDPSYIGSPYFQSCVACMETGTPFLTQYFLSRINRWMEVSVSKMDEEHQIYIFTDVTSIKEAQLVVERTATQLQTIIDRTQSGIFTAAPVKDNMGTIIDFKFVMANHALAAYVNQSPKDLIGRLGSESFTGYKSNGLFELFCDAYINKKFNRVDFHYNADGIDAWIDIMCTRFEDKILVTFTDYTPVKQLQIQLEQKVEELKRTNANLEEFAYAASHDLQEPLRKIHTFTERLKSDLSAQLNSAQAKFFERIEVSTLRMRNLIEDLLAYSQLTVNPDTNETVALDLIIRQVVQDLEASVSESGAKINVAPLPHIRGNQRQLSQLFQNLIGNAIKYRKNGVEPQILISSAIAQEEDLSIAHLPAEHNGKFYKIKVEDNGIGFEQQHAERIFQVFQRLHGRSEYEGTGVGLAIVQKVVRNHGGFIWAESEPDKGTTFTLLLPAQ